MFRVVASAHQGASARHVIRKTCKVVCANAREVISNSQFEIFSCRAEFTRFLWYGLFIQFFAVYVLVSFLQCMYQSVFFGVCTSQFFAVYVSFSFLRCMYQSVFCGVCTVVRYLGV